MIILAWPVLVSMTALAVVMYLGVVGFAAFGCVVVKLLVAIAELPILWVRGLIRAPRVISRGLGIFVAEGGHKELLWGVAICSAAALVLAPVFMW